MGIYQCADTLPAAIDCILHQTYQNWELILCDDGSRDDTYTVAKGYADRYPQKIKLIRNEHNMGLNATLNHCLQNSSGSLIARMDGDDLCDSDRFEKEVLFLTSHPEYAIVSTDMYFFDDGGIWGKTNVKEYPQPTDFIQETQFCHAPCMVRKEAYDAVGGYSVDRKLLRVEDYHLWIKMYEKGFRGRNLKEPLYRMRDDRDAQSRKKFCYRFNEAYVKYLAVRKLHLNPLLLVFCLKPIFIGLMPQFIYRVLHRKRRASNTAS